MTGPNLLAESVSFLCVGAACIRPRSAVRARSKPRKIKAMMQRLRQIGVFPSGGRRAVASPIPQPQMPLPHHPGAIAVIAQHRRNRRSVGLNQRIALRAKQHPPFETASPRITPRQQTISSRRATRRRRMRIGKTDAHSGQTLHLRRVKLRFIGISRKILISAAAISHSHIVGQHQNDIRRRLQRISGKRLPKAKRQKRSAKQKPTKERKHKGENTTSLRQ